MRTLKELKVRYIFCKYITEISRWGHVNFPWSCPLLLWLPSTEGCLSAGHLLSQDTAGQFPAPPRPVTPNRGCGGAGAHLRWFLLRDEAQKLAATRAFGCPLALLGVRRKMSPQSSPTWFCPGTAALLVPEHSWGADDILIFSGGIRWAFTWYLLCQVTSS